MKKILLLTFLVVSMFVPTPAQNEPMGENDRIPFMAENEQSVAAAAPTSGGLLLRTLGAMCLIVGLIFAGAWGLKKFGFVQTTVAPASDAPVLNVVSTVSLGANRSVSVVRFGERVLLVGSTAQGVTLLAEEKSATETTQPRSVAEMLAASDENLLAENLLAENLFAGEMTRATARMNFYDSERTND